MTGTGFSATYRPGSPGHIDLGGEPRGTDRIACMIDGSVANLRDLADLGEAPPYASAETAVACAFAALGEVALASIEGSWTILLWDRHRRTGLVARDPLGGRPLHYRVATETIELAGEAAEVLARTPRTPDVDPAAMAAWLARRPLPTGSTLLEGLRRLPAGHLLRLDHRPRPPERWWVPRYTPPPAIDRHEAAERLCDAMDQAVSRAWQQPGGVMLSGGFDSLSVAALASRSQPRLPAYSVVFPQFPEVDESARILLARDSHHLDLAPIEFAPRSPIDAASRFATRWRLPPVSPNGFVWEPLYDRAASDGVAALLDGEGGDELFGCSPALIADRLRAGRLTGAVAAARRLPGYVPELRNPWTRRALRIYGVREALSFRSHRFARRFGLGTAPAPPTWLTVQARGLLDADADLEWKRLDGPRWWASLVRALILFPDAMGTTDELRRAAGGHGLERRHPWRDLNLVKLVLGLPPELAFDPATDRPLARSAMHGVLDERLRRNQAKPFFNQLLHTALSGADRARMERLLLRELPDPLAGLIERDALRSWINADASVGVPWGPTLWPLLSASIWLSGATAAE